MLNTSYPTKKCNCKHIGYSISAASLRIPPYLFKHYPSNSINYGGGIGILYKSTLIISNINNHNFIHWETLSCSISSPYFRTFNSTFVYFRTLFYKPFSPSLVQFIKEFSLFLFKITPSTIILGDFNIPLLPFNSNPFMALLQSFNLHQHVTYPTQDSGNIIDLIIDYTSSKLISDLL